MPQFIPGLELSRRFYHEAVRPVLDRSFPGLPHAAALLGSGSDVLGFDTDMSTDHDWGPRAVVVLREEDAALADDIDEALRHSLPYMFYGYPVNFGEALNEPQTLVMRMQTEGPINHCVSLTTLRAFVQRHLAYDIDQPLAPADWLTFPQQKLRELTAGAVYDDGVGELTTLRRRLAWYPHDVWLYLLAAGWRRIAQEEHLMPRAALAGDELGSAVIGSRLVRDVMSLCFLMERQYAAYPKWFGTAFERLDCAGEVGPALRQAQGAQSWRERESALGKAYEHLARAHNALGITARLPETVSGFHERPFNVIHGDVFADAIREQITEPQVQRIAARRVIGSIDQFSDSTDIRADPSWRHILRNLYT